MWATSRRETGAACTMSLMWSTGTQKRAKASESFIYYLFFGTLLKSMFSSWQKEKCDKKIKTKWTVKYWGMPSLLSQRSQKQAKATTFWGLWERIATFLSYLAFSYKCTNVVWQAISYLGLLKRNQERKTLSLEHNEAANLMVSNRFKWCLKMLLSLSEPSCLTGATCVSAHSSSLFCHDKDKRGQVSQAITILAKYLHAPLRGANRYRIRATKASLWLHGVHMICLSFSLAGDTQLIFAV